MLKKEGRRGPRPGPRREAAAPAGDDDHDHDHAAQQPKPSAAEVRSWVVKWEFVLVAAGLIGSTLVGLWIAFQDPRRRRSTLILLLIGAALPVVTLFL